MGGGVNLNKPGAAQSGAITAPGGTSAPSAQVRAAPPRNDAQRLNAAHQHRAQCTANFRQALDSAISGNVKGWIASAGSKPTENLARANAFEQALLQGADRAGMIEKMHAFGPSGQADKIERYNQELEVGTRLLSTIQTAQSRYQGNIEILQSASPAQAWKVAQDLGDVVQTLRQTLSDSKAKDGSIGIFRKKTAAAMDESVRQLAQVISNHQRKLDDTIRQQTRGQDHVKALFDARDQIDAKINALYERLPKDKNTTLPEAARSQIRQAVQKLSAERDNFNELIAKALADGPPAAAPPKRGLLSRLLMPTKLQQHFDQDAVTRRAAQGRPFQPVAGLDGRAALAAHLKGVFQAAGLRDADLPSRRELRERIVNWQPAAPPPARVPVHQARPEVAALGTSLKQVGQLHDQAVSELGSAKRQQADVDRHMESVNVSAADILKVKADTGAGTYKVLDRRASDALREYDSTDWDALEEEVANEAELRELEAKEAMKQAAASEELDALEQEDVQQEVQDSAEFDQLMEEDNAAEAQRSAELDRMLEEAQNQQKRRS